MNIKPELSRISLKFYYLTLLLSIWVNLSFGQYQRLLQTPEEILDFYLPADSSDTVLVFEDSSVVRYSLTNGAGVEVVDRYISGRRLITDTLIAILGSKINTNLETIGLSYDQGRTWQFHEPTRRIKEAIDHWNNSLLLVDENNTLLATTDFNSFDTLSTITSNGQILDFRYLSLNEAYAISLYQVGWYLHRSTNGGTSWSVVNATSIPYKPIIYPVDSGVALVGSPERIRIIINGYQVPYSYSFSPDHKIKDVILTEDSSIVCIGEKLQNSQRVGFVYYTRDRANSWYDISPKTFNSPLIAAQEKDGFLYLSNENRELLRSIADYKSSAVKLSDHAVSLENPLLLETRSGSGMITLKLPEHAESGNIKIYDSAAKVLFEGQIESGAEIQLKGLKAGFYACVFSDASGIRLAKNLILSGSR
jgi:hypothetical protein